MIDRRALLIGSAATIAAPYVLKAAVGAPALRVRRDVQTLSPTDPFFLKYATAVVLMHRLPPADPRHWRNQALLHVRRCRHNAQDFLHWHRHYILYFERSCISLLNDPTFALPYWNWAAKAGSLPTPFYDRYALNPALIRDPSNALAPNWGPDPVITIGARGLQRGEGVQADPDVGQEFTQSTVNAIKQLSNFTNFTNRLETSPHNHAHDLIGGQNGHMSGGMSPLDPIFWLHHCNVDRIWAEWQAAGNITPAVGGQYSNHFFFQGRPLQASSGSAVNFLALGYTYDSVRIPPNPPRVAEASRAFEAQQILAADNTPKRAVTGVETDYSLPVTLAARALDTRSETGGKRILAKIWIRPPQKEAPILCKVFVNCPYLNRDTPSTDKYYAGSFGFFGPNPLGQVKPYIVDLTEPLRVLASEGLPSLRDIKLQIMPIYRRNAAAPPTSFEVEKIEIIES